VGDALADRLDDAGGLVAEEERELVVDPALAVVQVGVADPAGLDLHHRFARPRVRHDHGLHRDRFALLVRDDPADLLRHGNPSPRCPDAFMRSLPCEAAVGRFEHVLERDDVDVEGVPVAVLRMAHGPVNAMDLELCQALSERFSDLADDPARAVVVTGSDRAFSAGVDLKRATAGGDAYIDEFLPALADAFRAAFELPKPLVAAVNGHAIAGGCVLAACADVVLMAEGTARIGVPELRVGVPFPRI